jgi:nucleoid-associated protein YgaU
MRREGIMVLLVVFLLVPVGCGAATAETQPVPDDGGLSDTETYTIRVEPTTNQPPEAVISILPTSSEAGDTVSFSAAGSTDVDGYIKKYAWDFGDGTKGEGVSVTHVYKTPGTYNVTLTVTDDGGLSDSASEGGTGTDEVSIQQVSTETYTVKSGDCLMGIARERLGDPHRWREIANLNGIGPPYTIYPGQELKVPKQ